MESAAPAVSYKVNLLPKRHELEIELLIPELEGGPAISLQIPGWVPGNYEFAKFGRDIFDIAACEINTNKRLAVSRVG
jgi:predicted metalloprotease with PDZ domain